MAKEEKTMVVTLTRNRRIAGKSEKAGATVTVSVGLGRELMASKLAKEPAKKAGKAEGGE